MPTLTLDNERREFELGATLLEVARDSDVYIPTLCFHPDLPAAEECGLCAVAVEGRDIVQACATLAEDGMVVQCGAEPVIARRRKRLAEILTHHPHACLTCAQAEGCPRTQCSANVPEAERCCPKLGACELQRVAAYIGIPPETPRYIPAGLPRQTDEALFARDLNLCIACTRCLRVCRDVRGVDILEKTEVEGRPVVVPKNGQGLVEAHCRFCGACVEVCPTGALLDKASASGPREERLLPCSHACPAGVDVPGYLRLVAQGRFDEALALVLSRAPLPGVLGLVCTAPCEAVCRRGDLGGAAAVAALKRACADFGAVDCVLPEIGPPSGRKVAVVGAGPAGMTAAVELRRLGHAVVLFDEQERPGGILRSSLPPFRLPRDVVDSDVERVLKLGVDFRGSLRVGRDVELKSLLEQYDAVLLAVGAQLPKRFALENRELPGVFWGLDFLREAAAGRGPKLAGGAVVVGGGSVAVDCALTALRLGATSAVLCALESRDELPAHPSDLQLALNEGVQLMPSWGPVRVLSRDGRTAGLELIRCTSVFDAEGRFAPEFDAAVRTTVEGGAVILAIGQEVDRSVLAGIAELAGSAGPIPARAGRFETGVDRLFACGDAIATTATIVDAIASGRSAALAVDRRLGGDGVEAPPLDTGRGRPRLGLEENFAARLRAALPFLAASGLSRAEAMAEAARCLQCDLRLEISSPPAPPARVQALCAEQVDRTPEAAGVYRLYDSEKRVFAIAGRPNLREALREKLGSGKAAFFDFELNEMYTARESELIQQHLAEHGEMPEGDEGLDDLF